MAKDTLFQRAVVGVRRFDREVADSPLDRWAYVAFALGGPVWWMVYRATASLRSYLAVVMIYGTAGYERAGIRYLGGRPPRFSNGSVAPFEVQFVVGVLPFIAGIAGAIYIAHLLKRVHDVRR